MEVLKRVMSVSISERDNPKRPRLAVGQEEDSGSESSRSNESVYSVQQRTTDLAGDSSDSSDITEYEVAHLSPDAPYPFFSSTNDSDEENEIDEIAELGAVVAAVSYNNTNSLLDAERGILADSSEEVSTSPTSNSDVDPELPRLDLFEIWNCVQCNALNENRYVPYCDKCYSTRKNFFPPRPRSKRRLRQRTRNNVQANNAVSQPSASQPLSAPSTSREDIGPSQQTDADVVDGPIKSSKAFTYDVCLPRTKQVKREESASRFILIGSSQSSIDAQPSTSSGIGTASSQASVSDADVVDGPVPPAENMCEVCLEKPKNGLFYHGKSAHLYACYLCAKKIWSQSGKCPLCRKKINKVIRLLQ